MFKIVNKKVLGEKLVLFDIEADKIAKSCYPGQFLIIKIDEKGERVPITICDYNREKGIVTIVVQEIGATTLKINALEVGDSLQDVVGPLGNKSELVDMSKEELQQKNIILVAGGLGAAPLYPQAKFLSEMGIKFDVIIGARSKNMIILEDEFKKLGCDLYICTDDESYGYKGPVTNVLKMLVEEQNKKYNYAVAIGPAIMMKFTCLLTKEYNIKTIVSMNTIMVDGTGMCGACRLMVGDELKFACIDGPEFDGHKINFDEVMKRQAQYKDEEGRALLKLKEGNTHHGGCGYCGG